MQDMFDFTNCVSAYGVFTKALEASFRKNGNPIRRCKSCDKVTLDDYEVLNCYGSTDLVGKWVNKDEDNICPFLHSGESDVEYFNRKGRPDDRKIQPYTAYLRYDYRKIIV